MFKTVVSINTNLKFLCGKQCQSTVVCSMRVDGGNRKGLASLYGL